ncbi:retron Ec67 family RNA-directed DNA polymerase/endonuclease [Photobacterium leiognathi]|uniref:retron Ec67 family RNA-directed DNA polymerase/endonuclease n=1 Tax=Photobacterium leiognathi TaxID=553611 RepID=UPI002980E547|nr:retron Ec67 family RNA-directed DNA polymerase/endonuclease [Photobacterium leiognathi]
MSTLKKLKKASDLATFAKLLGYKPKNLTFIIYKIPSDIKYSTFEINKKNGKKREISAPIDKLRAVQTSLALLLSDCLNEIEGNKDSLSHGFKREYSIVTNANCHRNKKFVLNFDLEDFFGTINFGRVRGFFIKNKHFKLSDEVATVIAQIACYENKLPQGSPCSPVISNLIAHILDIKLVGVAKKFGCFYSRYADDITLSTNLNEFPLRIARKNENFDYELHPKFENIINYCGFKVNKEKTRLQYRGQRQTVTGLVVNKKVNIRKEYYSKARSITHTYLKTGSYSLPSSISPFDVQDENDEITFNRPEKLSGILSHIHLIKNKNDLRCESLKRNEPSQFRKMYKDFLFYKYFGVNDKPLIICEGITDDIYLRAALKKLHKNYPELVEKVDGKYSNKIKFLKFSRTVREVLEINGGTGDIKNLIADYEKVIRRIRSWNPELPVIILTDNDSGGTPVFSCVNDIINPRKKPTSGKKKSKERESNNPFPEIKSNDDFYYIYYNLYLVKTPHIGQKHETYIESFFDEDVKKIKLGNKSFSLDDDIVNKNKHLFYGKRIFAEQVIANNYKTINFNGFIPLLDRITKVIDDYNSRRKKNVRNDTSKQCVGVETPIVDTVAEV